MKSITTSLLMCLLMISGSLSAQNFQEISIGPNYVKQSFVKLNEGTEKQVDSDSWDLAFTAIGFQDAGILINEASSGTTGENLPQTELYYTGNEDFYAPIDLESILENKIFNSEVSWSQGAFNELKDPSDPFNYGWGQYNPANHNVEGNKVFVLKLRDGSYKKIKIDNLDVTIYNFRYADLDGSNEVVRSYNKQTDNFGQQLMFFSFETGDLVDILPEGGFDLMYTRYVAWAHEPNGGDIEQLYTVTGILSGPTVKTAAAIGVNPDNVDVDDYENAFSTRMDIIGFDWKELVGTDWAIADDRAYFVKQSDNTIWKLIFIDFEGSATGTTVFQKTKLGSTATTDIAGVEAGVFPNPVSDELVLSIDAEKAGINEMRMEVLNQTGRVVLERRLNTQKGFNVYSINTSNWNPGMYVVRLSDGLGQVSKKVVKL